MTEAVEPTTTETVTTEPTSPEVSSFKNDPKYLAMAKQLSEFQRMESERKEADAAAKREAEEKRLKDAGLFDELTAKHKAELESIQSQHSKMLLEMNLKTELIKTGFQNDIFVNGAIKIYDADTHGDIAAYVASLAADEANKALLAGTEGRTVHTPPGKTPTPGGMAGTLTGEQLKTMRKSDNPEERTRAIEYIRKYNDKNDGEFPPGYL